MLGLVSLCITIVVTLASIVITVLEIVTIDPFYVIILVITVMIFTIGASIGNSAGGTPWKRLDNFLDRIWIK